MVKRIVFLCSGVGGNLKYIYECQHIGSVSFIITGVIADRKCDAIKFASLKSIPNALIHYDKSLDADKRITNSI